ncbi:MAG TPA: 8-amino-7-oxononanoate synthase [Actinomycetes bacterium]|nr:8-amino-7-oxononanoate synthase [Actinomycetes bacterium]
MNADLPTRLRERQRALRGRGLERSLRVRSASADVIDLAGNDYLGLARDQRVVQAAIDATREWGSGATASRLVTGTTQLHEDLEHALADFVGCDAALVFSSGYLANLGVITALSDPGTLVVVDAHAHASLFDAARLSRGQLVVAAHNDVDHVRAQLRDRQQPRALVVTESVFSVDGDTAPLGELSELCLSHDATLVVDEAHAIGTSESGRGLLYGLGLARLPHVVVTGTLSKALGSQGGFVAASPDVRDFLINRARPFIYDTALAPASCAAAMAALQVVVDEPDRVDRLRKSVGAVAGALGVSVPDGAVMALPVASPHRAVEISAALASEGVLVGVFRPPSVPDDISRIRVTVRADLDESDLAFACDALSRSIGGA